MEFSNVNLIVFLVLIFFILITESQSVYGEKSRILKREKEDWELEKQLKILNKKPTKTIKTEFGDTIDCIDIYKQPAFDHPLLKNHKIQMVPSSIPEETTRKNISSSIYRSSNIDNGFRNEKCPPGTVPIRRTKKEDLINTQKLLPNTIASHPNAYTLSPMNNHVISIVEFSNTKAFFGATAYMSVHELKLDNNQFSTAQIWIKNGPDEEVNSIEFGWMVYPALFGDSRTRLFGYWTADNQKETGCFDVLCPGFVQVDSDVSLGAIIEPLSVYGKDAWELPVKVYRDPQTGNWWLITDKTIGYWPKEIFTHLANNASIIRFGGVAGAQPQMPAPPMGNGYFPQLQDFLKTAYMREMKYIDEKGHSVNLNPYGVPTKHDITQDCYNILFAGNIGWDYEITMAFGGPGGICP
ncbi:hypothetical protein C5167_030560 [Papaver somniferum]|uniref:uncharacterized protein LOC113329012 n=1 Tax=Papaver somniferum TaxID=3469 RepID=UPI000E7001CA|nr:uncharacterized protein LOC113329012 [Papaver somniferum]RZC86483.1 hypothetical protein C5167_030560 [Papaver somniferum]